VIYATRLSPPRDNQPSSHQFTTPKSPLTPPKPQTQSTNYGDALLLLPASPELHPHVQHAAREAQTLLVDCLFRVHARYPRHVYLRTNDKAHTCTAQRRARTSVHATEAFRCREGYAFYALGKAIAAGGTETNTTNTAAATAAAERGLVVLVSAVWNSGGAGGAGADGVEV